MITMNYEWVNWLLEFLIEVVSEWSEGGNVGGIDRGAGGRGSSAASHK